MKRAERPKPSTPPSEYFSGFVCKTSSNDYFIIPLEGVIKQLPTSLFNDQNIPSRFKYCDCLGRCDDPLVRITCRENSENVEIEQRGSDLKIRVKGNKPQYINDFFKKSERKTKKIKNHTVYEGEYGLREVAVVFSSEADDKKEAVLFTQTPHGKKTMVKLSKFEKFFNWAKEDRNKKVASILAISSVSLFLLFKSNLPRL